MGYWDIHPMAGDMDCAKQLYDRWDKIIAGENIPLKQEIGLFEKFESHPPGDGLINVQ